MVTRRCCLERTITEQDMDPTSMQFVQGFRTESPDFEPDLSVDGLSESLFSRLVGILSFRRSA
jgi:hypothetical protein